MAIYHEISYNEGGVIMMKDSVTKRLKELESRLAVIGRLL